MTCSDAFEDTLAQASVQISLDLLRPLGHLGPGIRRAALFSDFRKFVKSLEELRRHGGVTFCEVDRTKQPSAVQMA